MSDDDSQSRLEKTQPLPASDLEEVRKLPEFPDREEFVRTLEMDSSAKEQLTRPMQPVLDQTTKRYDVPQAIMELARRSAILNIEGEWAEFQASVDEDGSIVLPEEIRKRLANSAVTIRIKISEE